MELGARLAQPWLIRHTRMYYYLKLVDSLAKPDSVLIWSGRPHVKAEIESSAGEKISYELNAVGWRDREFNPVEMLGNALVFGDSSTFGVGVPYGKRFTELLENGFHGLDVWNASMFGYAPDQDLMLAERWLPSVPWMFLLVQVSEKDLRTMVLHNWVSVSAETGIPSGIRGPKALTYFSHYSEAWNFLVFLAVSAGGSVSKAEQENALPRFLFSLKEISKLAKWRKVPMVVLWESGASLDPQDRAVQESVVALSKEQGFTLVELPSLEHLPYPDGAWTKGAHLKVAETLFPKVKEILFSQKVVPVKESGH